MRLRAKPLALAVWGVYGRGGFVLSIPLWVVDLMRIA